MASLAEHQDSKPSPFWLRARHSFAHLWPRVAAAYIRDLWIRLPAGADPREKIAALTFDDGPTDAGTPRLLNLLAAHGIHATFFLSGESVRRFPQRVREIVAAGHSVGNHFRRHIDCWRTPPREVIREVTEGTRIIEDVTGLSPAWCRPPYGRLTHAIVKWSRVHRQQIVLWDTFPPDYLEHTSAGDLARVIQRRLHPRSIVCLHDNPVSMTKTPEMLGRTLPGLLQTGWAFTKLPRIEGRESSRNIAPIRAA